MASDTDNLRIPFSEGYEYEWVKIANSEDFKVHSEYGKKERKIPPAPLKLVKEMVKETLGYPEVLKALFLHMQPNDYPEKPVKNLASFYILYLDYKYGNPTDASMHAIWICKQIAIENWTGLDDPKCSQFIEDEIKNGNIFRNEQSYDQ